MRKSGRKQSDAEKHESKEKGKGNLEEEKMRM